MGMSASQARFLSLTARKTNVEYEGQQINQQRTTLSNQTASYYSQLTNMTVPTPPSGTDFTKITYTFSDGLENNTINTLIAQRDGYYILNYTQETLANSVVANGTVIVTRTPKADVENNYDYYIGASKLRLLGEDSDDQYLNSLQPESVRNDALLVEQQYLTMLQEKYQEKNWYVRYQQNSSNGAYEPVFYSAAQMETATYSDKTSSSISGIKSYTYGQTTETREIRNAKARVEQDSKGRYMSITIYETDKDGKEYGTTYALNATTVSDDKAYNDAMNQYHYNKAQYEQEIQRINSKIEIIQTQDKDLELRLKQLDTEESAISTEIDAVKKVISKNVDSTFKTFNA
ncbi:hypothetical protein HDR58_08585 [bacterium]|nr:hypothetical protein [bacterium]